MKPECLRIGISCIQQFRFKSSKFKPKVATTRPLQTPSSLALEYFDFYYGPVFGRKWPSIRLGLQTPNRYMAVMNTMSEQWKAHEKILLDIGAVNVLELIGDKSVDERIFLQKHRLEEKRFADTDQLHENFDNEEEKHAVSTSDENKNSQLRSVAGIEAFCESVGEISLGELHAGKTIRQAVDETSGYKNENVFLPRREHFVSYPQKLRVLSFGRAALEDWPAPLKDHRGVPSFWLLDGSSLLPVIALGLQSQDTFLDVCAAPGGKSLLALLSGLPSKVVCNDFKMVRLGQLKRALMLYTPDDHEASSKLILKRKNAGDIRSWDELDAYDKVLADVPCSTDRLSVSVDEHNIFSHSATQLRLGLPDLQTRILVNSMRSAKVGGSIVYSTCSMSPSQNEIVVENAVAFARKEYGIKVVEEYLAQIVSNLSASSLFRFQPTSIGFLVVPFLPSNFGPMYVCKLTRLQ